MRALYRHNWECGKEWVLALSHVKNHGLVAALSNGSINLYPLEPTSSNTPVTSFKAHSDPIKCMRAIDENLVATCSTDSVKVWDLRSSQKATHTFTNDKFSTFLSLDSFGGLLASGTELVGADAGLYIWDLRSSNPVRSLVDSHHDDITEVRFHPTNQDVLLSGSTDGYVNLYDLSIADEDDAMHQVINYASIHSANFITPNRIFTLSHMETFAIHELNDKSDELTEPAPNDFGDIREAWDCEYVVDIYPGYVAVGSNSKESLTLYPFDILSEKVDTSKPIWLPGAHGEEVVRSVYALPSTNIVYSGGEDGSIKVWETPFKLDCSDTFMVEPRHSSVVGEQILTKLEPADGDDDMADLSDSTDKEEVKKSKKRRVERKEKKEKVYSGNDKKSEKDKKDKKNKKDKKDKSKHRKDKKEHKFKPY